MTIVNAAMIIFIVFAGVDNPTKDKEQAYDLCWSVTNYWPYRLYYIESGERVPDEVYFYDNGYFIDPDKTYALLPLIEGELVGDETPDIYEWIAVPFEGQADGDPNSTANGWRLDPIRDEFKIAAVPSPFVGETLIFPWGADIRGSPIRAYDTFGNTKYRAGIIYHDTYEQWVMPVDILTWWPLHYLECNGHWQ